MTILLMLLVTGGLFLMVHGFTRKLVWEPLEQAWDRRELAGAQLGLGMLINWMLTLGIAGTVANFFFSLDVPHTYARYTLLGLGLLGLLGWRHGQHLMAMWGRAFKQWQSWPLLDRWLAVWLAVLFLSYFYRCGQPWFDQDEVGKYGYLTKLIAHDYLFKDFFYDGSRAFSALAELISAPLYWVGESTLWPRVYRVVGLVWSTMALYGVLRLLGASLRWSLLGCLLFAVTPEFSYIVSSLKADSLLMQFEWAGLLIIVAYLCGPVQLRSSLWPLATGVALIALATATRTSAAYSFIFSVLVFGWFLWKTPLEGRHKWLSSGVLFLALNVIFVHYYKNLIVYWNPIYPLSMKWMRGIEGIQYLDIWNLDTIREYYNIQLGNRFLEYIYLPIHLAFGFETTLWDRFSFIPHPPHKGVSLGWGTPAWLMVILCPMGMFFRSSQILKVFGVFGFLYVFWHAGVQYSRVFLAGASLTIILAVMVVSLNKVGLSRLQRLGQGAVKLLLVGGVVVFTAYQGAYVAKKYHHSLAVFYDRDARFEATRAAFANLLEISAQEGELLLGSAREVEALEGIFRTFHQPSVIAHLPGNQYYHMFFEKVLFQGVNGTAEVATYLAENQGPADCMLALPDDPLALRYFPDEKLVTSRYSLRCRKRGNQMPEAPLHIGKQQPPVVKS